jgi:hypothetical protein
MAPELFSYKLFDSTGGERQLFGIVNAADMCEALQKAASFLAQRRTTSRIEIERTDRCDGDNLGHLSQVAELLASHVVKCTNFAARSVPERTTRRYPRQPHAGRELDSQARLISHNFEVAAGLREAIEHESQPNAPYDV